MPRLPWLSLVALLLLSPAARPDAGRTTPGLVLETGAPTATTDGLAFTAAGGELLAWGEDKVVRQWAVGRDGFTSAGQPLRWPIFREQRGSIFAVAQAADGRRVAVAGFGVKTGLVAVLPRTGGGDRGHALDPVPSAAVNWAVAFSRDDRFVIYGNDHGELYRWEPGTRGAVRFAATDRPAGGINRVRLIATTGGDRFVSVTMDGQVREWDVTRPGRPGRVLARFTVPNVFRATVSPDRRWLAAAGATRAGTAAEAAAVGVVELLDLHQPDAPPQSLRVPRAESVRVARCLAFDADSARLAVGCQEVPADLEKRDFFRVLGGSALVYDLGRKRWQGRPIRLSYRCDAVAFHPRRPAVLATAGGANHEVALWDITTGRPLGPQVESAVPGRCVWGVAFSKDGRSFGWKDRRNDRPTGRNDWAAGPWRVFDIARRDVPAAAPAAFDPVEPIPTLAGWSIAPTATSAVWEVVGPGNTRVRLEGGDGGLYNGNYNQEPRCWTFVPPRAAGGPVRLVVGHQWGASLYECRPGAVRLVRVLSGHAGEVMAVAPSADGRLLLTGSRDQTVCCWSLVEWPTGGELGAAFEVRGGRLVVARVDPGSPAWEPFNPLRGTEEDANRLRPGDVIDLLVIRNERLVYDPVGLYDAECAAGRLLRFPSPPVRNAEAVRARLQAVRPAQEYLFGKRVGGKGPLVYKLTTVRQRPLWRLFVAHTDAGREWVIWRPRDGYYDTSANGDRYVGWHVNDPNPAVAPAFHPLERYRGTDRVGKRGDRFGLHRPDRIWPSLLSATPPADAVPFTDVEAAWVGVQLVRPATATTDLEIQVNIAPPDPDKPLQRVQEILVWVNECLLTTAALKPDAAGQVRGGVVTVPRGWLRAGTNAIRVQAFNAAGGRGEAGLTTTYTPAARPTAVLRALCVGINDYSASKTGADTLRCSTPDAAEMARVLRQHQQSKLFGPGTADHVVLVDEKEATAKVILEKLGILADASQPDDWLVLYLAGHGAVEPARDIPGKPVPVPGSYFYVCRDTDYDKPETKLTSKDLYRVLARARCRKLLILDTCHAGAAAVIPGDLARDLTPDGKTFFVLAACQADQQALEPGEDAVGKTRAFFTQALLNLVGDSVRGQGQQRVETVPADELQRLLRPELTRLLAEVKVTDNKAVRSGFYFPAFRLPDPETTATLCRPKGLQRNGPASAPSSSDTGANRQGAGRENER